MLQPILYELRSKYKLAGIPKVYLSIIPDTDYSIPWIPLSIKEFIEYSTLIEKKSVPFVILENEIFSHCVIEQFYIDHIDKLPAGIISSVVEHIWQHSGPNEIDSFNNDLDIARNLITNGPSSVLHEMVSLITTAFPYKPEEVYAMDYEVFLTRLIQAESKLMKNGLLTEPIQLLSKKDGKRRRNTKRNLKQMWDERHNDNTSMNEIEGTKKWWKESPILEAKEEDREYIKFKSESEAINNAMGDIRRDPVEYTENYNKMMEDARVIYKDVLEKLEARRSKK